MLLDIICPFKSLLPSIETLNVPVSDSTSEGKIFRFGDSGFDFDFDLDFDLVFDLDFWDFLGFNGCSVGWLLLWSRDDSIPTPIELSEGSEEGKNWEKIISEGFSLIWWYCSPSNCCCCCCGWNVAEDFWRGLYRRLDEGVLANDESIFGGKYSLSSSWIVIKTSLWWFSKFSKFSKLSKFSKFSKFWFCRFSIPVKFSIKFSIGFEFWKSSKTEFVISENSVGGDIFSSKLKSIIGQSNPTTRSGLLWLLCLKT